MSWYFSFWEETGFSDGKQHRCESTGLGMRLNLQKSKQLIVAKRPTSDRFQAAAAETEFAAESSVGK
jgi:hypothetical protein